MCLCAAICTHAHTNTYTREIGREQERARSIVRARSSLNHKRGSEETGTYEGSRGRQGWWGVDMQVPELAAMLTCGAWSCLQDGRTAMMHAALSGHVEVVDRLLAAGADKDAQSKVPGCV